MNTFLTGWLRWLVLRWSRREIVLTGGCRQCGTCCRRIQIQSGHRWLRSRRAFARLQQACPEYQRFAIIGRDRRGLLIFSCSALQPDNRCGDYAQRPSICRQFPEKALYLCGGTLPQGCGFKLSGGVTFARRLQQAQDKNSSRRQTTQPS
ncbi:MAG: YkgJ family cysteine cluster protein [Desulfuromonadaceae bacterium]|nr:YkgJ family cysteine cluster protein [Desulfuromonadaceae bacterium]